jgi:hypothetical protein
MECEGAKPSVNSGISTTKDAKSAKRRVGKTGRFVLPDFESWPWADGVVIRAFSAEMKCIHPAEHIGLDVLLQKDGRAEAGKRIVDS